MPKMHAIFLLSVLVCLSCTFVIVCSNRYEKEIRKNEILYQEANVIAVKFPNLKFLNVATKGEQPGVVRRRVNTNVQPVQENCQTKTFRSELNRLRQKIKCEPRDAVVDLISLSGDIITPNAVVVKRCGGMCAGSKRCLPLQKVDVKFYVRTIRNNQMHCSSIVVSEDTKCKCACQQKPSDCNEHQVYVNERCGCVCKNEKDYVQCVENGNENFYWDEKMCSCICQQSKSCTTGTYWDEYQCRCAKMSP